MMTFDEELKKKVKLKERKVYKGSYKGVAFEINNWRNEKLNRFGTPEDQWTFYLYINLGKIPKKNDPESFWLEPKRIKNSKGRVFYEYNEHPVLGKIEFHGEITWYSKETSEDVLLDEKLIKVGCDYMHLFDYERISTGWGYTLGEVLSEVMKAIDSFKAMVPNYKYWCWYCGGFWDRSEGELSEDEDSFISFKGIKKKKKYSKKIEKKKKN